MKKLWVLIPLVLLLTLAACKSTLLLDGSTPDTKPSTLPTESDPTEPSVTPTEPDATQPTQSDPTESTVPPTESVETHPFFSDLVIFIYGKDKDFSYIPGAHLGKCKEGYLYYYHRNTHVVSQICDEPVVDFASDKVNFFFVKESEPTKLYWAPQSDLTQQKVIYESDFGVINDVYSQYGGSYADKVVTLTEGNKRLVAVDLATAEVLVMFDEVYYIECGSFEGLTEVDGKPSYDCIWFWGQPTEGDRYYTWFYWPESGTFTLMEDG